MSKRANCVIGEQYINANLVAWAQKYRIFKGGPYRFDGSSVYQKRSFLKKLLADTSRKKTFQKSRQCGVTENNVSELLGLCATRRYKKFMYLFPTQKLVQDFVNSRVNPAIQESPEIKRLVDKQRNSVHLKHIGTCDVFFRGATKGGQGEGTDIDALFIDERDRMKTSVLKAFEEGLSSSAMGYIRDISTPSLPGYGVNISFEQSDKKHWFVRCTKCNEPHNLVTEFPENIVKIRAENKHVLRCLKCGGIDCIDRTAGEWVAQRATAEWSGYQISQLDCPWIPLDEIMAKREAFIPQLFFNYILGLPYVGSNVLITQQHINNCIESGIHAIQRVGKIVLGVDWGDISWAVIGMITHNDRIMILHFEKICYADPELHIKRISELMDEYKVDIGIGDVGYGKERNAIMMRKYSDKWWACGYMEDLSSNLVESNWRKKTHIVKANRTITLKVMARAWQKKEFLVPAAVLYKPDIRIFRDHLVSLAIKLVEDSHMDIVETIGSTGPDHFAHAVNYLYIGAYELLGKNYASLGFLTPKIVMTSLPGARINTEFQGGSRDIEYV
jgi:hypothetical protein